MEDAICDRSMKGRKLVEPFTLKWVLLWCILSVRKQMPKERHLSHLQLGNKLILCYWVERR